MSVESLFRVEACRVGDRFVVLEKMDDRDARLAENSIVELCAIGRSYDPAVDDEEFEPLMYVRLVDSNDRSTHCLDRASYRLRPL